MSAITADALAAFHHAFRIVHHVPGRLRVRLAARALPKSQGVSVVAFRRFVEDVDGVTRCRISPATLSAIIEYDHHQLSPGLWDRLIGGTEPEARLAFASLIEPSRTAHADDRD